jgi:hypothetical protein
MSERFLAWAVRCHFRDRGFKVRIARIKSTKSTQPMGACRIMFVAMAILSAHAEPSSD